MAVTFYTLVAEGLRLSVRLTPKASRDRIQGVADEADGQKVLKAQVTAVPEDGKANLALLKLLAKQWRLPRTSLGVVHGATERRKTILITGDGPDLARVIEEWMAKHHD